MRTLLWLILFVSGYVWLVKSGNDDLVMQNGKSLYKAFVTWFDDTQIEFHFKKDKIKKRSRRWD